MYKVTGVGGEGMQAYTQLAVHRICGCGCWLGQCQRVGWSLTAPGAGRRGGPRLAMSEIDSGLPKELENVESQAEVLNGIGAQRDFFSKGELRRTGQGPHMCSCPAIREGGLWVQFAPTQYNSRIDQRGAK